VAVRDHCFDVGELRLVDQRRAVRRVKARVVVELTPRAAGLPPVVDADVREPELQQRRAAGLVDNRIDSGLDTRLRDVPVVAVPGAPSHRPGAAPTPISPGTALPRHRSLALATGANDGHRMGAAVRVF
jgi:hypothetical protein